MKTRLIFAALFIGLSCNKEPLCGCSPIDRHLILIIKSSQNADLLDPSVPGAIDRTRIKMQYKQNGVLKDIAFGFGPPYNYNAGQGAGVTFNQLISSQIAILRVANTASEFYLDLGKGTPDTLTFDYPMDKNYAENVKLNGTAIQPEPSVPSGYDRMYAIIK
ncbi:hypothetical protein [Hufsiella ginkgonis]|uniref:Uncharacterized protein n=1 Tax=Hufsiella ginkgonis TaxID=2695274 RepID=A0A7K1Y021_9SPHI|nr:hypothetical protein [Hufsiella ginkgonis]MXV16573.1 hypothetical protein [Hufsiella ginkgonis]